MGCRSGYLWFAGSSLRSRSRYATLPFMGDVSVVLIVF